MINEVVKNISLNNPTALKQLWDALAPDVYKLVYSILKSDDDAKEVTQMVFIKIWEVRNSLKTDSEIKPFLFTIARNSSYDVLRKKYREKIMLGNLQNGFDELYATPEDDEATAILRDRLSELIEQMPQQRRSIFLMSRFQGLTYKQIAQKYNISENTVDTQMRRALKFLREHLSEEIAMLIISSLTM